MSLWNPYAFSVTGQALAPVAPPALRAYGAEPTAEQRGMAQTVYVAFCSRVRLSAVPNPTEQGRFPDGTSYRITVLGPQTVMEIWPVPDDDLRRSGIGLVLTTLDGGLVSGHIHEDGDRPQPYILTPRVKKGSRITTGKWRVRKVDGYSGGKAVWMNKAGKAATVGVGGAIYDMDLLDYVSLDRIFGTNNRAYWAGEYNAGVNFFTDREKVLGSFRDRIDTIPFFRTDSAGKVWVMQLTPAFVPEPRIQLWGEEYTEAESTAPIGVLLHELPIPSGYTMIWQTISVSPDGKAARMVFRKAAGDMFAKVDLGINPAGISIVGMADAGSYTPPTSNSVTTGNQIKGLFTKTTVETNGWLYMPGGYGYDAKGAGTAFDLRYGFGGFDRNTSLVEFRVGQGELLGLDGYSLFQLSRQVTSREVFPGMSIDYGNNRTVSFDGGDETLNSTFLEVEEDWYDPEVSGGVRRRVRRTGVSTQTRNDDYKQIVFVDPTTDLYVTAHYKHTGINIRTTDYTYNRPPGGDDGTVDNSTDVTTHTYARGLTATCRGKEVLSVITPLPDSTNWTQIQYVASSATDPLTGAACVNVLEVDTFAGFSAPPLRSWIILVDDVSAKHLHEVMDVPDSTSIRVRKDYSLLSVV